MDGFKASQTDAPSEWSLAHHTDFLWKVGLGHT